MKVYLGRVVFRVKQAIFSMSHTSSRTITTTWTMRNRKWHGNMEKTSSNSSMERILGRLCRLKS
jgi:hypothetical protein